MSKRPTDAQVAAWQAVNSLCQQTARAAYFVAKAEGLDVPKPTHADVLLEWYDAVNAIREAFEKQWPGVARAALGRGR